MGKDKPIGKRFEKLEGLFNKNGESQQEEQADQGRDGYNEANGTGAAEQETQQCKGNNV